MMEGKVKDFRKMEEWIMKKKKQLDNDRLRRFLEGEG